MTLLYEAAQSKIDNWRLIFVRVCVTKITFKTSIVLPIKQTKKKAKHVTENTLLILSKKKLHPSDLTSAFSFLKKDYN